VNPQCVKTWKIIGDNLSKAGWTCRCISSTDHEDRQFELRPQSARTPDASLCVPMKSCGRFWNSNLRFVLTANWLDNLARFSANSGSLNESESGGGHFPRWFFVSSGPAILEKQVSGEKEEKGKEP